MTQRHITLKIRERNTNSDIVETINTDGADLTLLNGGSSGFEWQIYGDMKEIAESCLGYILLKADAFG
jgi:hypothetical protein